MVGITMLLMLMVVAGGAILWGCYAYVPLGDPEKVRIITRRGVATDKVMRPKAMFLWFKGIISDFIEVPRRFDVSVEEFEIVLPNKDELTTSLTMLFEVAEGGGEKFIKNGKQEGITKKCMRIARTAVERFAQDRSEEPYTADQAKKMYQEFILRIVDALVKENYLETAANAPKRDDFLDDLVIKLSENDGEYCVEQFGVKLVGLNMAQLVEPKSVVVAAAERKAAKIKNAQKAEEMLAFKKRMGVLMKGHDGVSFKDATMAVQIQEGTIQHRINEEIVRIVDEGSGDGLGKLIGGVIAAARAHGGAGGKGYGGSKKPTAP
ncbi:hypothetical protein A2372_04190 [Candidatus Wolfebacteria bacterium RIFOXYB1_FULL_54_12]|uniref:Band 7 domain-containing protein n=1 Tax=Candidatus Wolfebacteria bacterium RIFOXYB1_FULL_54_12 TaxID=1802559 RepID=A0A1F8DVK2_9BACT|nr:MAG: hypothetical protein A2372_04190 [Candidatus Wolfebacteria bacterium RIFOXYB1_FULL_54_12]